MFAANACQQGYYVVAMPFPSASVPSMMVGGAMPCAMAAWNPLAEPASAHLHAQTAPVAMIDVGSISGNVWQFSQDQARCRDVQRLLEESAETDKLVISDELRGHVLDATLHPYANYVLQKCIETSRPEASQFIIDELMYSDHLQRVAQHKFGCRILQRLLEHCRADQVFDLVQTLIREALTLVKSNFGTYVVQHILEYACIEQQRSLLDVLIEHASEICSSNISCTVVEMVMNSRNDDERLALSKAIIEHGALPQMARSRNGNHAVKEILKVLEGIVEHGVACRQILAAKDSLTKTRYGRSMLKMVEDRSVSDTFLVEESFKLLRHEPTRRMSWADMSEENF